MPGWDREGLVWRRLCGLPDTPPFFLCFTREMLDWCIDVDFKIFLLVIVTKGNKSLGYHDDPTRMGEMSSPYDIMKWRLSSSLLETRQTGEINVYNNRRYVSKWPKVLVLTVAEPDQSIDQRSDGLLPSPSEWIQWTFYRWNISETQRSLLWDPVGADQLSCMTFKSAFPFYRPSNYQISTSVSVLTACNHLKWHMSHYVVKTLQ